MYVIPTEMADQLFYSENSGIITTPVCIWHYDGVVADAVTSQSLPMSMTYRVPEGIGNELI